MRSARETAEYMAHHYENLLTSSYLELPSLSGENYEIKVKDTMQPKKHVPINPRYIKNLKSAPPKGYVVKDGELINASVNFKFHHGPPKEWMQDNEMA
jgi:hypothetical protein